MFCLAAGNSYRASGPQKRAPLKRLHKPAPSRLTLGSSHPPGAPNINTDVTVFLPMYFTIKTMGRKKPKRRKVCWNQGTATYKHDVVWGPLETREGGFKKQSTQHATANHCGHAAVIKCGRWLGGLNTRARRDTTRIVVELCKQLSSY